jgi:hypothetical protein
VYQVNREVWKTFEEISFRWLKWTTFLQRISLKLTHLEKDLMVDVIC